MEIVKQKYSNFYVSLGSEVDISRFFQYSNNERIEEVTKRKDFIYFEIKNLKEGSILCRQFIDFYNLGSSNWIGGRIIDNEDNFVTQVSYNGRVWESDFFPSKEIDLC